MTENEQKRLFNDWNQYYNKTNFFTVENDDRYVKTIHKLFESHVKKNPSKIALVCRDQKLTYQQLDNAAQKLARLLRKKHGVNADVIVGVCIPRSLEVIVALMGVLKAGGAYLPLDPKDPTERLHNILENSKTKVVIVDKRVHISALDGINQNDVELLDVWGGIDEDSEIDKDLQNSTAQQHDVCYIEYTSGSTGKPKGVTVTHLNLSSLFHCTQPFFNITPNDVFALFHSISFDLSLWEIFGALLYGGTLVVTPQEVVESPHDFWKMLCTNKVTRLMQTPISFSLLSDADAFMHQRSTDKLSLITILFCGDKLEYQNLQGWFDRHGDEEPQLYNTYGITETTVYSTLRRVRKSEANSNKGSMIGCPINNTFFLVLNKALQPVPLGTPGELFLGGEGIARGYLGLPEMTAKKFIKGHPLSQSVIYRSGDLVRFVGNADYEFLGRIDYQVKVKGIRIEPKEIELTLCSHALINQAVVISKGTGTEKKIVAFLTLKDNENRPTETELKSLVERNLPKYMIPRDIIFLRSIPVSRNGKIDRLVLTTGRNLEEYLM